MKRASSTMKKQKPSTMPIISHMFIPLAVTTPFSSSTIWKAVRCEVAQVILRPDTEVLTPVCLKLLLAASQYAQAIGVLLWAASSVYSILIGVDRFSSF